MRSELGACQVQQATNRLKKQGTNFTKPVALIFPPKFGVVIILFFTCLISDRNFEGTVMEIEKTLINDRLGVSKYLENFTFQLFIILSSIYREICYFLKN